MKAKFTILVFIHSNIIFICPYEKWVKAELPIPWFHGPVIRDPVARVAPLINFSLTK